MEIKVHSIHFDADKELLTFIQERVDKLDNIFDRILGSEVYLKVEKSSQPINKITEIKLNLPGKEIFAKKQGKSFEEATDIAVDALRRQLKRYKAGLNRV